MVNKYRVLGCHINYQGDETGAVFKLPADEDLKRKWIAFLDREDVHSLKNMFVKDILMPNFWRKMKNVPVLAMEKNPVPTILPGRKKSVHRRKEPALRIFQEDQLDDFKGKDAITDFSNIDESYLKILEDHFHFSNRRKM